MSHVLRNITFEYAVIYVDDILVYSGSFAEHLQHLSSIFARLRKAGLRLKPSKCNFLCPKVTYLGHKISCAGVEMEEAKVKAVADFPRPHNTRSVRAFLGLCNYYRRFIKGFCHITKPLNDLLQADATFNWDDNCEEAFQTMKKALTSEPIILSYPDFKRDITVH